MDLVEVNEARAARSLAVEREAGRRQARYGLASCGIGEGQGVANVVERG